MKEKSNTFAILYFIKIDINKTSMLYKYEIIVDNNFACDL